MDSTKLTDVETMVATLEESQLIGRVKEKSDIMKLITNQASHQRSHVVSIWGMGGLGKTTLVQDIYRSPEIGRIFDKRACITVMRPFNSGKLVESIAKQFGDENEKDLAKLLEGSKRYLVVLDDLWSTKEWDDMMLCLPSPSTVARCIIVTTREENIAMHCSEERNIYKLSGLKHDQARHLFTKK
uniref:NB-ARC domain-containing protein n=2 Tax=Oryza brachyantha TaxID=4533 RepID=J3LIW7_ORYBR